MVNWIDILLLLVIVLFACGGWRRGFIMGAADLVAWAGSLVLSFLLFPYVSVAVSKMFPGLGIWLTIVSFFSTLLIIRLVLSYMQALATASVPQRVQAGAVNRWLGIIPGAVNGLITAAIIALLLMVLPLSNGFATQAKNSRLVNRFASTAAWVENNMSPVLDSAIRHTVTSLAVEPGTNDYINLHFTTGHYTVRHDLETQMLLMVNEERAKKGIAPLVADTALAAAARQHAKDMFERGYFCHNTPEGKSPAMRLQDDDIGFMLAGENLALAQTLGLAHTGLMHSPGHRANILNAAFHKIGIGILDGGMHGLMIAQEFTN
ncbi:MAG TPA: CvpA family protein [Chitinophagaceae bacterium]|nr:CvpA family protein [Chitinophagaceae bacterium]